jgi:hypothetical protein
MNYETVEIIKPNIASDMNAYWAMHYCSLFETLYEHKTLEHSFQRPYFDDISPTLHNLMANAGFSFFQNIKQSMKNFGLQSLLCHYLTSREGSHVFFNIMTNLSNHYNYELSTNDYGVFISCKDFASGSKFISENNPILLGYRNLSHSDAAQKVTYADLCFLFKKEDRNLAVLGEVEGNKGGELLLKSFWSKKKGDYYSFGIGVKKRSKKNYRTSYPEPSNITGEWINTEYGWKYIVIIESDHYLVDDFHSAIDTLQTLLTFGSNHKGNYVPYLIPILNLIREYWNRDIIDLIKILRTFLISDKFATLGTNPLSAKTLPNISS